MNGYRAQVSFWAKNFRSPLSFAATRGRAQPGIATGSGKSLVALALHFKAMSEGKVSVYTAPIKALVSEKFFALCEDFGAAYVGMMTGDATINRDAPILCCTAEILANVALREGAATRVEHVVMDALRIARAWIAEAAAPRQL